MMMLCKNRTTLLGKLYLSRFVFFFFQAEDGIRDSSVTGVQTCALPICHLNRPAIIRWKTRKIPPSISHTMRFPMRPSPTTFRPSAADSGGAAVRNREGIGRAAGRGRGEISGGAGSFKKKKRERKYERC